MKPYWVKHTDRKNQCKVFNFGNLLQLCGQFVVDHNPDTSQ